MTGTAREQLAMYVESMYPAVPCRSCPSDVAVRTVDTAGLLRRTEDFVLAMMTVNKSHQPEQ